MEFPVGDTELRIGKPNASFAGKPVPLVIQAVRLANYHHSINVNPGLQSKPMWNMHSSMHKHAVWSYTTCKKKQTHPAI